MGHRKRNIAILCTIVIIWIVLDQLTKLYFNGFAVGQMIASPIPGVVDFVLVHNTGAAWGMFDNMTIVLAVFSIVVCVFVAAYIAFSPNLSILATVGLSLVVAGGIGNVIDRFANGYVIDFISAAFMDFPVFNIADIGVTCGVALFIISVIIEFAKESKEEL